MDGGVADTGPQRGSAGSGVVAESAADSVVARSCVRVRLFNLFVVVGILGTSRFSLSLCDPCARVPRVSRGRVCSSSPQVVVFSVGVNEGSDATSLHFRHLHALRI